MAKLVSMKRTPKERKIDKGCEAPITMEEEKYPYGLRIDLSTECLSKLGEQTDLLSVGATVSVSAEAKVESMSARERDNSSDMDACLQITKLSIDKVVGSGKTLREVRRSINSTA